MRSTLKGTIVGATVAGLLLAPQLAAATSVEEQIQAMQDRMGQMEEQLQATHDDLQSANERVDQQAGVIRDAGLADDRSATSGLSSFLSDTEFYGWVNTSYTLNSHMGRNSDAIENQNLGQAPAFVSPGHPSNMSFALDQVWFGMDNAATADSRAGFHVDLLFGSDANDAHLQGFGCTGNNTTNNPNDWSSGFCVFTANVSYLAPIGPNGVNITMGKMATLLGAEVVETPWNFNITRGILWGLQPVTNIGLLTSADLGGGFSLALGVIDNPIGLQDPDNNKAKSFTGQIAWSNDTFGASLSGNWGDEGISANPFNTAGTASILDLVLSVDPTDSLSLWLNFDWVYRDDGATARGVQGDVQDDYGFALAGRYGFTDDTGLALRGEFIRETYSPVGGASRDTDQWSITATVDHNLTDNLMLRGEFRYDQAYCDQRQGAAIGCATATNAWFADGAGSFRYNKQFLFLVDMTYEF